MERSSLTKRCVYIEEPNEKLNQDDMRKYFPSAKQICTIKSPSPNEDDPTIHWLLLFASEEDADDCAKKKRKHVEDNYDLMIHHCNRPCDIPHDWIGEESSGDSFDITGATNQPEEATNEPPKYDDICPTESMPMPGPTYQQPPQGNQGQQPYGPYPGYLYHNPNQPPPYGGHPSQPDFQRPPSHPDLKRPQSEHDMNRQPPGEKMPKIEYPYGPGVHNPQVPGEYNQHELGGYMPPGAYIPPGAFMPPGDWPYQYYGPNEQNLSEKKGPDDVPGPSVQPHPYYPQFFQGYHGLPVHPNYPYPQDDGNQYPTKGGQHPQTHMGPHNMPMGPNYPYPQDDGNQYPTKGGQHPQPHKGPQHMPIRPNNPYQHQGHMGMPQPEQGGLIPHHPPGGPPVDPDHTNVKSQIHNLVTTQEENPEKTDEYNSDESYKSASSNKDEGRVFDLVESGRVTECYQETSPTNTKEKKETVEESQQSIKMIKVSNIPTGSSEDSIRFFFENKRKSGGGDIEDLDYDEDTHTAIITFEEEDVAERVISRMPLLFEKKKIDVEIFQPRPPTPDIEEGAQASGGEDTTDMSTEFVIEVRGMKPTTSEDTIRYYFESRKVANADVLKMEFIEEKEMYMVWFEEESAIEAVMSKSLRVDGQTLNAKRYVPPPPPKPVPKYDNKVFITNISPTTTKDGLENFLEAKSKGIPEEIIFGEAEGTALVTFEQPPDMEKLQTACMRRQLDGSHLSIHTVPITDCIVVTGYKDNTSSDTMEYYFDNKRRSGVEGVREVKLVEDEGKFLVYFLDPESALTVCKREHKVEGQILKVQVYYECLGQASIDDDGPKFKSLKPTVIPNIDPKMIEFLLNSETNKVAFEKQLSRHYAVVEWPDSKKIEDKLEVNCTLTEEVKDCRKLAKTWAKTVKTEAEKFFSMLTVKEIQTLQESWDDVMKHLRELSISNPESVAIKVVKEDCKIVIVGHKMPVEEVAEKVEIIMKDVAAEQDRRKLQVTEEVSLKHFQLLVLLYLHFLDKMKKEFEGLSVHVNMKKHIMIFTGMTSHVNAAKVKMFEQIQEITSANAGKFSIEYIEFLKIPEVKSYVGQQIKQKGVLGVWDVEEGNVITMYSLSDEGAVTACNVLKKSIIEAPINIDAKQSALIGSNIWNDEIKTVEMEYQKALVKIVVADSKTVVIYMTSAEDEGIVKEKINDIFYHHAVSEEKIQLPSSELRLLQEQYQSEIGTLKELFAKDRVTVNIDNIRVFIQGNLKGVKDAKQKIDEILKSIYKKKYTMKKAGIVKHMTSDQGQTKISQVEKKNKVVVHLQTDDDSEDEDDRHPAHPTSLRKTCTEIALCTTPSGQTITIVVGDITELDVDVIVNAANKDLKHVGGLAKVIVDKGGNSIQKECDDYVGSKNRARKMYEGEIFCSAPGNLNCKMIAHAVGPVWQNGRSSEDEYLSECIQASLEKTEDMKYRSIAIPALCTGIFGYPANKATKVIVEAIRDYMKENGASSPVRQIYLCDVKEDIVDHFVSAVERFFDKANVKKQRGRSGFVSSPPVRSRHGSSDYGPSPSPRRPSSSDSHISVTLIKGQIATQEVDMIVNTTSTSLQLNQGAVSQSLLKMGGPGIQTECSQKYPTGIQPGEVAETSGGKIECKMICHGALPGYNGTPAMKIMETFMKNCLQIANDNRFVSVAFPALGTGNLGYPKNQVAKNMFSCVDRFSSSHPKSSVCDVRFVVYEKDYPTIKAFEEEQRKRQSGDYVSRETRNLGPGDTTDQDKGASGGWQQRALADNRQASVDIGDLTLKVYQGDLTEATVDVIVNGTNKELDLKRGGVSQAILQKGGRELSQLLSVPAAKKEMRHEGVATTTAGRNFSCDFIIHINMEESNVDLKAKFKTVLEKVDELNKKTVALPALGAGISYSVDKVAENLFEALVSFQRKTSDIAEVHVVIYEKDKLSQFLAAMQNCIQSQSNQSEGLFSKFKGIFGYGEKKAVSAKQWKVSKMPSSVLNLVVYAKKQKDADSALRSLEESLIIDYKEKVIEDAVIKELSKDQEAKIMKLEETCEVEIEINKRIGRIKVRGLIENLSEAMDEVHKIVRDFDRQKQKQQHAKLVADMVQWYFISVEDTGQKLEEYPPEVNLLLEQALKNNEPQAFFLDNSGNKYIVDFNTYEEFPEDDQTDTVAVLRKSKMTGSGFDMPSNWAPMDQNENIKIVTLQPADKEYQDVVKDFQTNMAGNYNSIVKMEKIQNRTLQQQYAAKKKSMDSTNAKGHNNELKLWHGTAMEAVDSINTYGFNRSYCGKNAVAYGNGVYFAVNPTYSAQAQYARPDPNGNKRMYMCKVLVGEYTKGQGGMKVPPPKPGAAGGHILYDSVVDNPQSPGIVVIFHDTQAYPEYLIVFK